MNFRDKILTLEALPSWRAAVRDRHERLVVTNGCFDLLHVGHVIYLESACQHGDLLLVGLNSDASVRQLKGPERPLNGESDRAAVLAAMQSVSAVCIFSEPAATRFLWAAQPDVYVKGGDYTLDTLNREERQAVEAAGARIVLLPFVPGKSTSNLIEQILKL